MHKKIFLLTFLICCCLSNTQAQTLYYPPLSPTANWDTISPSTLGWCTDKIDSLYNFLGSQNTKGLLVLKDGKIVLEKYFDTFTKDSLWYWASAGKTITSFLIGKAQEEGHLSILDKSSNYLGSGWTSCTTSQEDSITIRHQLTMTTGLDDGTGDPYCTIDTCLHYLAPVSSRWAYHNAPYTLLEEVIQQATTSNINIYTTQKLKNLTGMNGFWFMDGFNNVYASNVRSMARFGLLISRNCVWQNDTLLHDMIYKNQMINSSQSLNPSYGYLWWLNGKSAFMVPSSQLVIPGSYAPHAPNDMYAALGKNGQMLSISPSKGLIVVRMGNSPSAGPVGFTLLDDIWVKINELNCNPTSTTQPNLNEETFKLFPNPVMNTLHIQSRNKEPFLYTIYDMTGNKISTGNHTSDINVSALKQGVYQLRLSQSDKTYVLKFVK